MRSLLLSLFLIMLLTPSEVKAQRDSLRNLFQDAESWFLYDEFQDALPLYEALLHSDPENDNLKYKIGICLLNDPYQKDRSIKYLLEASKNMNPSSKEGSFKETTAPADALFYLGNAYLVNEALDKAIETYKKFLEIMDKDVYDEELVQEQIQICRNAEKLKASPVDIDLTLLDSLINTRYAEINPVLSGDGTRMAFVTRLAFYDAAFFTEKSDEGWSYPQPITQTLGFDSDVYPVALSFDGTEMILYYDDEFTGNLFYSRFENGSWLPAIKLGANISTKYWESNACFSKDGQTLYFTSNRKGTNGGLDIYKTQRLPNGKWDTPQNLGPTINSRYNEESPIISEDGNTLYFSSFGHYNMGGYDVFFSKKKADGTWGEPKNMGYPINTTENDLFFQPLNDGKIAYYSIYSPRGMGLHDIYRMEIYSEDHPRIYGVTGILRTEDGEMDSWKHHILVIEAESGDTIKHLAPEKKSGNFNIKLTKGSYLLHFSGTGYKNLEKSLLIDADSEKRGITLKDNIILSLLEKLDTVLYTEVVEMPLEITQDQKPITQIVEPETIAKTKADMDTIPVAEQAPLVEKISTPEPDIEEPVVIETQNEERDQKPVWLILMIILTAGGFLFWLILWRRRRKKEENQQP